MKIPKSIKLAGRIFKTEYAERLPNEKEIGYIDFMNDKVILRKTYPGGLSKTNLEQTYIHELTHAIFDMASYPSLSEDENLVNRVSEFWYQVIQQFAK